MVSYRTILFPLFLILSLLFSSITFAEEPEKIEKVVVMEWVLMNLYSTIF
jgi:hypothetical protein